MTLTTLDTRLGRIDQLRAVATVKCLQVSWRTCSHSCMTNDGLQASAVLAALPSSNMSRTGAFFERLIGRPVDERPMPVLAQWSWGSSTLQIVDDAQRAGGGLATIIVPDMRAALDGARARGVSIDSSDGTVVASVAVIEDPDGNQLTIVQAR